MPNGDVFAVVYGGRELCVNRVGSQIQDDGLSAQIGGTHQGDEDLVAEVRVLDCVGVLPEGAVSLHPVDRRHPEVEKRERAVAGNADFVIFFGVNLKSNEYCQL
jgi:hypothetical protein